MSAIRVLRGVYRNQPVQDVSFTLVKGFQTGKKGGYVTVQNEGQFPGFAPTIRITVDNPSDIEYTNSMTKDNTVILISSYHGLLLVAHLGRMAN